MSTNYIDKEKLLNALMEFEKERNAILGDTPEERKQARLDGMKDPRLSEYIGHCILTIAQNYVKRRNYYRLPDAVKEDMVSCGVLNACIYVQKSYDSTRSATNNPFSFITYCVWSGITAYFKDEKKNRERTNSYIEALQTGQIIIPQLETPDGSVASIDQLMSMIDQLNSDLDDD